jgi:hypothetical protein
VCLPFAWSSLGDDALAEQAAQEARTFYWDGKQTGMKYFQTESIEPLSNANSIL